MCKEATGREMTLEEEIANLDIDNGLKERLLKKFYDMQSQLEHKETYLRNCHYRISELERALIEVACDLGTRINDARME